MRQWVCLLHTPASMVVRARAAAPLLWLAGVRQGCPRLALLYLFVAETSARWLHAGCALQTTLARQRIVGSHHSDDTKVYLPDLQKDRHLLQRAHRFVHAFGQFFSPPKPSRFVASAAPPWAALSPWCRMRKRPLPWE
jgi:hypothetical protein